jgi:hypothetical protein
MWYKLMNRTRSYNTWVNDDIGRIEGEYKIPVFNVISEHIMFHWLDMNYYWSYSRGIGFIKLWDLDTLLDGK